MVRAEARPPRGRTRQAGYVVGAVVNALMLLAVNVWPGWEKLPFLTQETELVIGLVTASILVNLLANVVYALVHRAWLKPLGDVITTWIGLLALVKIWQVFPFDFEGSSGWDLLTRVLLAVGIGGSCIGILAALVNLTKALHSPHD